MRQIILHSVAKDGQTVSSAIDLVAGKSARIAAQPNMHRFEIVDPKKSLQHGMLKLKRKGNALEVDVVEDGDQAANLVIENFYSAQYNSQLLGMTENDFLADYLASNGSDASYLSLADGQTMYATLGFTPAQPFSPSAYLVAGTTADAVGVAGAAGASDAAAGAMAGGFAAGAGTGAGGSMLLPILGGAALIGLAAAGGGSDSGGGGSGGGSGSGNDTPLVVSGVTENSSGTITVTGTSKAGASVEVKDKDGAVIGTSVAGADGKWSVNSQTPVKEGALSVVAKDNAGYDKSASGAYDDVNAPTAVSVTNGVNAQGDRTVSGTGEPGATVEVTLPGGSKVTASVKADGTWGPLTVGDSIPSGTVSVKQTDINGNMTDHGQVATLPVAPNPFAITSVSENPNGTLTIAGTAKPGADVTIKDKDGNTVGTAQAGNDGKWSLVTTAPVGEGSLSGKATDSTGYDKSASSTYDDATGPGSLTATTSFNPLGQRTVSGTGEPGATVELTLPNGSKVTTPVGQNGTWGPVVVNDNIGSGPVSAKQTDINGNATDHGQVVSIPSAADPFAISSITENANGTITVTGTAKAGSAIALRDENGDPIGSGTADGNGAWSVTTTGPVPEGPINGTATGSNGYSRTASTAYDDSRNPSTFSLNGAENAMDQPILTGTGEPGATVTITLPNGNQLQSVVAGDGTWTAAVPAGTPGGTVRASQADINGNSASYGDVGLLIGGVSVLSNGDGTATVSGTTAPSSTVSVRFPSGETISIVTPTSGVFSITSTQAQSPIAGVKDISIDAVKNGVSAPTIYSDYVIGSNNAPSGTDGVVTGTEDAIVVFFANSFGFSDADGHTMSGVRISSLPSRGTLFRDANDDGVLNAGEAVTSGQSISISDINAGRLKFIGAQDGNGTAYASFQFQVQDNGPTTGSGNTDTTPNTMVVNLNPTYDAPTLYVPPGITIDTDVAQILGYRVNDPDNSPTKTVTFTMTTSQGTLTATEGMLDLVISGNGTDSITISGPVSRVNANLDSGITWRGDSTQSVVLQSSVVDNNPPAAPVAMDLNGDGVIGYTDIDHTVSGESLSAWVGPDDGVLFWDKFGDGQIHDVSQWQFTTYGGKTDLEGLAALGDLNLDVMLDKQDALFASLAVWQDANTDGKVGEGEVHKLADLGIEAVNLASDGQQSAPLAGVHVYGESYAALVTGGQMLIHDAAFDRVI